ncbi:DUF1617 family protein [Enterococcus casseliflavus]|uniref:DUF1617 family protein n=1 Tax=Enterococcus casseliflavus TaxID=37734 RepID=UPI00143296FC|nr:DUF1617 family protein [Enterococcus casseliflavus]NKD38248.1 DUF1617 family protein [Enterococcus casseliflavus]
MNITLKNNELMAAITFLEGMPLSAKDSRHRTKLVKRLKEAAEELFEEEKALMEKFNFLTEASQLKATAELDPTDIAAFNAEQAVLMEEEVVIEYGMYAKNIAEIPRILESYDEVISGKDAEIYDRLLDEFENAACDGVEGLA